MSYIVQEPILGGELYDYIAHTGCFSEKVCRYYFKQMLKAVNHLHEKGFAHRDLKPENMLLDENFDLKLIDFGFAANIQGPDQTGYMQTMLGTPMFMAPEIIQGNKYMGKTVDLFALGVILFAMRAGHYPFDRMATKDDLYYRYIVSGRIDLFWKAMHNVNNYPDDHFSEDFKDLLVSMLSYHASNRLLMVDLIGHPWM